MRVFFIHRLHRFYSFNLCNLWAEQDQGPLLLSALPLRQLSDPILHGAGNLTIALSRSVFKLISPRALQAVYAFALDYFYSRVHLEHHLDTPEFAPIRFLSKP
jgi:hypothetical protein